jgi:hypothetical protein
MRHKSLTRALTRGTVLQYTLPAQGELLPMLCHFYTRTECEEAQEIPWK